MASEHQHSWWLDIAHSKLPWAPTSSWIPVMADYGKLYGGANEGTIRCMKEMLSVAHLCFPNYTEACLLTDEPYKAEGITQQEAQLLVNKLRAIGSHSVLITSCIVDGKHAVVGYNHLTDEHFLLPYEEIPVQFPGTGDIFSSIIEGRMMDGDHLRHATEWQWTPCTSG